MRKLFLLSLFAILLTLNIGCNDSGDDALKITSEMSVDGVVSNDLDHSKNVSLKITITSESGISKLEYYRDDNLSFDIDYVDWYEEKIFEDTRVVGYSPWLFQENIGETITFKMVVTDLAGRTATSLQTATIK